MFEEYKNKIGHYIFKKKILKNYNSNFSFNNFVEKSFDYVLILPLNDLDFNNSFDVAKYFKIHKKNVTLFLPEYRKNLISITNNYNTLTYNLDEITKFGLPNKDLTTKIEKHNFDVLIDLERDENLFLASIASLLNAKFKVGFKKANIENLYNFQLVNTKNKFRNIIQKFVKFVKDVLSYKIYKVTIK